MHCFERFFVIISFTKSKPSLANPSQPEYYNLMPATSKQQQRRDPTGRSMDSSRWSLNQQEVVQQPLIDDQVEQKIYIYQKFLLKSHHTGRFSLILFQLKKARDPACLYFQVIVYDDFGNAYLSSYEGGHHPPIPPPPPSQQAIAACNMADCAYAACSQQQQQQQHCGDLGSDPNSMMASGMLTRIFLP